MCSSYKGYNNCLISFLKKETNVSKYFILEYIIPLYDKYDDVWQKNDLKNILEKLNISSKFIDIYF